MESGAGDDVGSSPDPDRVEASRTDRRPWLQGVVGALVMVAAFAVALPRFADYSQVWTAMQGIDRDLLPALVLVASFNLVAPALTQMAALPGGSASCRPSPSTGPPRRSPTWFPGGSAIAVGLTWTMYRSLDLCRRRHRPRSVVVTGVWDTLVKLGLPLPAVLWLATQRPVGPVLVQAAMLGAVLFVVAAGLGVAVLAGPGPGRQLGLLLDRLPLIGSGWPGRLDRLRRDTVSLLGDRGPALSALTLLGHANLYLLLVLCLRIVGVDRQVLGLAPVLAAFAFGRLVTALPLTPGGLGVMEVGLVGALAAVGDAPDAEVVAAVLLFRFCSFALPLPLGLAGWLWWSIGAPSEPGQEAGDG